MNISYVNKTYAIGKFSDGSDRKEVTTYDVTVVDGAKTYFKTCDSIPTEADIDLATFMDITPKPTLEEIQQNQLTSMGAIADMYSFMLGVQDNQFTIMEALADIYAASQGGN